MNVFDLWLPTVATGFATHVWSTLAWTVLPHHKPEWTRFPAEDELQELLQKESVPGGQYMIPYAANGTEASTPAFQEKQLKCRAMLVRWSGPMNMGQAIGCTLAFFFGAAFVIAYVASLALAPGADFMRVLQFVMTVGLLTHCAAHFPHVFWFQRRMSMELLDGVVLALITGLVFAGLWPAA